MSSGPRTNPWYQEASDRVVQEGEMISFDTDMIGPYGYGADLSRSWTCGHVPMSNAQSDIYRRALDQIEHNTGILRAGTDFGALESLFEAGMVACVESLMAAPGTESVKLETQVLITENGPERLDRFPWEMYQRPARAGAVVVRVPHQGAM